MTKNNQNKTYSYVDVCGGVPALFVNGRPLPAAAYMTYLREYNDYASFAAAGYRLFSAPVLFAGRWINSAVDGKPFHAGIFDDPDAPDFTPLDAAVREVLAACPEAYVIPRLNLAAPLWWISAHPYCTDGTGKRELLFAEEYARAAEKMLRAVLRHAENSDYAERIVGYQLAGGNTEEWFHFDLNGGYCENAASVFAAYLKKRGFGGADGRLPDLSPLRGAGPYHNDARLASYLEFANETVAELICRLCRAAKDETGGRVAVGTFYGYSLEVASPLWGTHALHTLLACENVDFICSPNSYIDTRARDADWTEMYPAASVRLHGKLCMQECDVRTHLTRPLWQAAPAYDPERRYVAPIWQGLPDREAALCMLKKTFCRQLIAGNGFWWFDMWGGWYRDPVLLAALREMREVYEASLGKEDRASAAELAVFVDETAYRVMTDCALRGAAFRQRVPLGYLGAPYATYDVFDFEAVYKSCKAALFLSAANTENMRRALALCRQNGVSYLAVSEEKTCFSASELRAFCARAGVHVYCETDDLFYVGRNYFALHASAAGEKTVTLREPRAYRELLTEHGLRGAGKVIKLTMRENETRLFAME